MIDGEKNTGSLKHSAWSRFVFICLDLNMMIPWSRMISKAKLLKTTYCPPTLFNHEFPIIMYRTSTQDFIVT